MTLSEFKTTLPHPSPNTVAVSVDDGVTEQVIILSSNLKESGAVLIREFRVE